MAYSSNRKSYAPINVKPGGGGGGRRGIGRDFDRSLWPGVGIFEFLLVSVTTNHFPGWRISDTFDLTFLPTGREFDSKFLENVNCKILPY